VVLGGAGGSMSVESLANVIELEPKSETSERTNERGVYRLVEASLGLVGGIESAASIMKFDRGDLRRALDDKGRYLAVEHVMRFGKRLMQHSPETAQRIAVTVMRPFDLIVSPRVQMTAAEQARRYKSMLDALSGAAGVDLASKALETP
jgi:hypothetical protein